MNYLQPELVERVIKSTRGTVFSVTTDEGTINARLGVIPSAEQLINCFFKEPEQDKATLVIRVFDIKKKEHRTIDKNKVIALKANRKTYKVEAPL